MLGVLLNKFHEILHKKLDSEATIFHIEVE